jgi:hypothetical protein
MSFGTDLIVRGKFMAGLPERPLTRDCVLGLSWKGRARFETQNFFRGESPDDVTFMVVPAGVRREYSDAKGWQQFKFGEGSLRVYSTNPAKARLVLDWCGLPVGSQTACMGKANFEKLKQVKDTFLDIYLLGDVDLNGVVFNHIAKQGITVKDPEEVRKWRNVAWGPDNAGKPEELIKKWDGKPHWMFERVKDF